MKLKSWNGPQFADAVLKRVDANVKAAAIHLTNELKRTVGQRIGGKGHVSQPGNPPFRQTGNLFRSIGYEMRGHTAVVGSGIGSGPKDPGYAVYLEFGTKKMSARPWLRPTYWKQLGTIRRILSTGFAKVRGK